MAPMDLATQLVELTREKRQLDQQLAKVKREIEGVEAALLDAMENGDIPASFKLNGASVYTRVVTRASAKDGNHQRLIAVLKELGLTEYLPSTVNSNSISAYVREHIDDDGELVGLDPLLAGALNITEQQKVVVNF